MMSGRSMFRHVCIMHHTSDARGRHHGKRNGRHGQAEPAAVSSHNHSMFRLIPVYELTNLVRKSALLVYGYVHELTNLVRKSVLLAYGYAHELTNLVRKSVLLAYGFAHELTNRVRKSALLASG